MGPPSLDGLQSYPLPPLALVGISCGGVRKTHMGGDLIGAGALAVRCDLGLVLVKGQAKGETN